jgi:hypothetical protein
MLFTANSETPTRTEKDRSTGRRERKGSGDSALHVLIPENVSDYCVVTVQSRAGTPTLEVEIAGTQREFFLDTGSRISLIQPGVYSSEVKPTNLSPFGVTGKELEIKGVKDVLFYLDGKKFSHQFCVCSLPTEADGIIGMDFLAGKKADLNLENHSLGCQTPSEVMALKVREHGKPRERPVTEPLLCS